MPIKSNPSESDTMLIAKFCAGVWTSLKSISTRNTEFVSLASLVQLIQLSVVAYKVILSLNGIIILATRSA